MMNTNLRSGKWTPEEEVYAQGLMEAFRAGAIVDLAEGTTMRGFLAKQLRCFPKRVSKKYENKDYNGKQQFVRDKSLTPDQLLRRRALLQQLEHAFIESLGDSMRGWAGADATPNNSTAGVVNNGGGSMINAGALGPYGLGMAGLSGSSFTGNNMMMGAASLSPSAMAGGMKAAAIPTAASLHRSTSEASTSNRNKRAKWGESLAGDASNNAASAVAGSANTNATRSPSLALPEALYQQDPLPLLQQQHQGPQPLRRDALLAQQFLLQQHQQQHLQQRQLLLQMEQDHRNLQQLQQAQQLASLAATDTALIDSVGGNYATASANMYSMLDSERLARNFPLHLQTQEQLQQRLARARSLSQALNNMEEPSGLYLAGGESKQGSDHDNAAGPGSAKRPRNI